MSKELSYNERMERKTPAERRALMESAARAAGLSMDEYIALKQERVWGGKPGDPIGQVYSAGTKVPESAWKPAPMTGDPMADQWIQQQ